MTRFKSRTRTAMHCWTTASSLASFARSLISLIVCTNKWAVNLSIRSWIRQNSARPAPEFWRIQLRCKACNQRFNRASLLLIARAKCRRFVDFANLTLAVAGKFKEPLGPFDRLFLRFDLKECEAADHFLRLGEGTVGHGKLPSGDPDARAFRTR